MNRVYLVIVVLTFSLMGCNDGQVLEVTESKYSQQEFEHKNIELSTNDKHLLYQFIEVEAGSEPYIARVALAAVVLNRMEHPDFPKEVASVISQINQSSSLSNSGITTSESSEKAVIDALSGWDPVGGALYYSKTDNLKLKAIKKIGNITFY